MGKKNKRKVVATHQHKKIVRGLVEPFGKLHPLESFHSKTSTREAHNKTIRIDNR